MHLLSYYYILPCVTTNRIGLQYNLYIGSFNYKKGCNCIEIYSLNVVMLSIGDTIQLTSEALL